MTTSKQKYVPVDMGILKTSGYVVPRWLPRRT